MRRFGLVMIGAMFCSAAALAPAAAADQNVIDAAKTEGRLVFYTGIERGPAEALTRAFQNKYPFVHAEMVRASSSKLATRLDAEIAASRVEADVFEYSLLYLTTSLQQRGEVLQYDSPEYAAYPKEYSARGLWAATGVSSVIIMLNTGQVDAAKAPQSWWDLAKPFWNGKLTIDNLEVSGTGYNWLVAVVNDPSLGWEFIEALGKNQPTPERGHAGMAQKVAAGEYAAAVEMSDFHLHNILAAAAAVPVRGVWPKEGVPREPWTAGILKRAPHPNAARLFLDFLLSKEGQQIYVNTMGWSSARADVAPSAFKDMPADVKLLKAPMAADEALKVRDAYIDKWKRLWGIGAANLRN